MLTKTDKASRKLRKERKNRAKKVDTFGIPMLFLSDHLSVAPRYQKSQGCRAPKEGQVNVQSLLRPFSCHVYAYVIGHLMQQLFYQFLWHVRASICKGSVLYGVSYHELAENKT